MEEKNEVDVMSEYIVRTDGNGDVFKIVNFENPKMVQQTGIVELEALKRNKYKQPNVTFKKITDRSTGITYGIPMGVNMKTKELLFKRIELHDVRQYDLSITTDRQEWAVVSRAQFVKGSPLASGKPLYRVIDHEAEADKILKISKTRRRATELAEDMPGVELNDMAVNLGISPNHNSQTVLRAEVIRKAEDDPTQFIAIYDDANRDVITIFNRCMSTGLISTNLDKGFLWKDQVSLGMSEQAAYSHMLKNPALLSAMDMQSKEKSTYYQKHASPEEMQGIIPKALIGTPASEKLYLGNDEIKEKMKALDEETARSKSNNDRLEAFLNSQPEKKDEPVTPVNVTVHDTLDEDLIYLTLKELQDVAFMLGIAVAKMTKKKEVLVEAIITKRIAKTEKKSYEKKS